MIDPTHSPDEDRRVMHAIYSRLFLVLSAALILASSLQAGPHLELGPMVGHAGPDQVKIWIKASGAAPWAIRFGEKEDLSDARHVPGPRLEEATEFMGHITITELEPDRRYYYTVMVGDETALARPFPSFNTAPELGAPNQVRFAFVSCLGRNGFESAAAWGDMAARVEIDLLLMLGDNHYADSTEPARQRAAYYSHRRIAGYEEITRHTPTYAIWDDHDYGPNDSDSTAEGKENSLRTFQEFWANPASGEPDNPGIYFKFSRGDIDFFMLDVRYHRSPNRAPNDESKTMLGAKQLAWLKRELLESTAKVKFIASGSEWQLNGHLDSWTSFDRERREIWDFMREHELQGVVFLSGDRHFTGAYQIQGRFIEVTSGPLGSRNFPTKNLPEMFLNHGAGKLYAIFEADTRAPEPVLSLEVYRAGEGLIEKRAFTWAEINGEQLIPPLPAPQP
jgi:alkaline phosphatase D